jgi:hypothetical protein
MVGEIAKLIHREDTEKEISRLLWKYCYTTWTLYNLGIYNELTGKYSYLNIALVRN